MTVGLYWEDWTVGQEWTTRGRTMTEAAIETCAGLSGDYNPLHTDEEYCKQTPFGTRIAHGPLTYLFAAGLLFQLHLYDDTLIAFLGFDRLRFTKPVKIGDTVRARVRVTRHSRDVPPRPGYRPPRAAGLQPARRGGARGRPEFPDQASAGRPEQSGVLTPRWPATQAVNGSRSPRKCRR